MGSRSSSSSVASTQEMASVIEHALAPSDAPNDAQLPKASKKPLNVEPNIIWVSTKKRPQFYANIAHGMLTDCFDKVVVQGIGNAIGAAVEVVRWATTVHSCAICKVWTETVMAEGNMQKPSINIVLVRNPALDDEDQGAVADADAEADGGVASA